MGDMRNAYNIFVGKLEGTRPPVKKLRIDGRVILPWVLTKQAVRM
jgi:hypothetical protein